LWRLLLLAKAAKQHVENVLSARFAPRRDGDGERDC
jgi:hypothetical protein